jgi:hypothetical protein
VTVIVTNNISERQTVRSFKHCPNERYCAASNTNDGARDEGHGLPQRDGGAKSDGTPL